MRSGEVNMNYEEVKNELTKDGEVVTHILEKWAIQAKDRTFIYYGEEDLRLSFHEFNKIATASLTASYH